MWEAMRKVWEEKVKGDVALNLTECGVVEAIGCGRGTAMALLWWWQ